jgi:hypothetical protein
MAKEDLLPDELLQLVINEMMDGNNSNMSRNFQGVRIEKLTCPSIEILLENDAFKILNDGSLFELYDESSGEVHLNIEEYCFLKVRFESIPNDLIPAVVAD